VVELSKIFPDEELGELPEIEYEFMESEPEPRVSPKPVTQAVSPKMGTQGSAPAAVKPSEAPSRQASVSDPISGAAFTIQLLSSKDKKATQRALEKAKAKGYAAILVTKDLGAKGVWHRLYAGAYDTKEQAQASLKDVKKDYAGGFVTTP